MGRRQLSGSTKPGMSGSESQDRQFLKTYPPPTTWVPNDGTALGLFPTALENCFCCIRPVNLAEFENPVELNNEGALNYWCSTGDGVQTYAKESKG